MGMKWGNMKTDVRGVIIYSLSPYEQKAFAGALSKGIPNMIRRIRGQFLRVIPPFIVGYMIYDWANQEHHRQQLKNPRDYISDE